jgi:hypothetical protein
VVGAAICGGWSGAIAVSQAAAARFRYPTNGCGSSGFGQPKSENSQRGGLLLRRARDLLFCFLAVHPALYGMAIPRCRERPLRRSERRDRASSCTSRNATEGVPYRCLRPRLRLGRNIPEAPASPQTPQIVSRLALEGTAWSVFKAAGNARSGSRSHVPDGNAHPAPTRGMHPIGQPRIIPPAGGGPSSSGRCQSRSR